MGRKAGQILNSERFMLGIMRASRHRTLRFVIGLVGLLYFLICYPLIRLSNRLEKRLSVAAVRL